MNKDLSVTPLPVSDWEESLAEVVADMNGNPINVHKLMAHHPALLKAWWNFRNYSVKGGELGKRKGELVILRVACHMKAWYEWGSHVERSLGCGLSMAEIERVKKGGNATGWPVDESLLINSVDELIANHALSKETTSSLHTYFSIQQIMDIIAIHGMYVILGCMVNTFGLELDQEIEAKLPNSVTKHQFQKEIIRK
jgi:4-carboxymuconolactone decarboxylase